MIIKVNTDQIKKIRDDAIEYAAKLVELSIDNVINKKLAKAIRAMKNSPVNVIVKDNKNG